jgi:hypothetical protein
LEVECGVRIENIEWRVHGNHLPLVFQRVKRTLVVSAIANTPQNTTSMECCLFFLQSIDQKTEQQCDLLFVRRKGLSREIGRHIWKNLSTKLLEKSPCSSNRRNICAVCQRLAEEVSCKEEIPRIETKARVETGNS